MKKLKIVKAPNKKLRIKSKPVNLPKKGLKQLILDMAELMNETDGIGISAPQVGINERIVIIGTEEGALALINPEITKKSKKTYTVDEGCLSLPKIFGAVERPYKISVKAKTIDNHDISFEAEAMFSTVIQHEIDHLDGILFIDRVKKYTQGEDLAKKILKISNQ